MRVAGESKKTRIETVSRNSHRREQYVLQESLKKQGLKPVDSVHVDISFLKLQESLKNKD